MENRPDKRTGCCGGVRIIKMAMEKHFIQEGKIRSEIENFLKKELSGTGYSGIIIQKTPLATRIILNVEKPPLVIGKKGRRINKITKLLKSKYGIDNPAIDVQKIENPTLDPNIVARRIAIALERGMNRRRVVYKALRAVMYSGARGIEIKLSGKIIGKGGRSRTEKYAEGYMKKAGDSLKLVDVGSTQAYLKAGIIGVTVKIVLPDVVFPDQISVIPRVDESAKAIEENIEEDSSDKVEESKPKKTKETETKETKTKTKETKTKPKKTKTKTKETETKETKTKTKETKTKTKETKTKTKPKTKETKTKETETKTKTKETRSKSTEGEDKGSEGI